jgi:Kelch motif protein
VRYRVLLPRLLTLGSLGLAACGEEATQPNPAEDQPTAAQLADTSNGWLTRRDMPLDLVSQTAAVVPNAKGESILYVIGGRQASNWRPVPLGEVRAYNVATNTWFSKRDMPLARYGMNGAGVINGKIYVSGGYGSNREAPPSSALFVYDPAADTWSRKRDMPAPCGGGATVVIGGKLYVVTFSPGLPDTVANFFRYNPNTDSWTRLPSPSNYSRLDPGGGGVIDKKLYLIGPRILEYDPVTNRWIKKASWGSGLWGRTVAMVAHLYMFGAELNGGGVPSYGIFIYDPVSDTWEKKPLHTEFSFWGVDELTPTRIFLNGQPRVEVVGGARPGNNLQYIP